METDIIVAGMTCQHCVHAVQEEIRALPGVQDVEISLVPHGESPVRIVSEAPLDSAALLAAVDEAGYSIRG